MTASASIQAFPMRGWSDATNHLDTLLAHEAGLVGVAVIDVDHFTAAREQVLADGSTAEALIRAVTGRLATDLNDADFTARIGDDDFLIIRAPLIAPAEIESVGLELVETMSTPLSLDSGQYPCTVSIGVATSRDGDSARTLLQFAQYALDDAKALGRNQMIAFDDEDRELLADTEV